jgi:hypothetical protein
MPETKHTSLADAWFSEARKQIPGITPEQNNTLFDVYGAVYRELEKQVRARGGMDLTQPEAVGIVMQDVRTKFADASFCHEPLIRGFEAARQDFRFAFGNPAGLGHHHIKQSAPALVG